MTDHHKQLSLADLDLPRKRGRPSTGKALTPAQKQKIYRDRLRQAGKKTLLLEPLELWLLESILSDLIASITEADPSRDHCIQVHRKLQQLL